MHVSIIQSQSGHLTPVSGDTTSKINWSDTFPQIRIPEHKSDASRNLRLLTLPLPDTLASNIADTDVQNSGRCKEHRPSGSRAIAVFSLDLTTGSKYLRQLAERHRGLLRWQFGGFRRNANQCETNHLARRILSILRRHLVSRRQRMRKIYILTCRI